MPADPLQLHPKTTLDDFMQLIRHVDSVDDLVCVAKSPFTGTYRTSPLHLAASRDHLDIVKYLVKERHANIELRDEFGRTPLHDAVTYNHERMVRWLVVEGGANINAAHDQGDTPLHIVCHMGYENLISFLVTAGANIDIQNIFGCRPINMACFDRVSLPLVRSLVSESSDLSVSGLTTSKGERVRILDRLKDKVPAPARASPVALKNFLLLPTRRRKFQTFCLGRHPRLGETSPIQHLVDDVVGLIFHFLVESDGAASPASLPPIQQRVS